MNVWTFMNRFSALEVHPRVFSKLSGMSVSEMEAEIKGDYIGLRLQSALSQVEDINKG